MKMRSSLEALFTCTASSLEDLLTCTACARKPVPLV